jgi:hypothetical protein
MSLRRNLEENNFGSTVDKIALFCAVVAILSVLGAHGMDRLAQNGDLPVVAFNHTNGNPGVDYSATASIPDRAGRTRLSPCGENGDNR